jgi:hypothetical protein
MSGRWISSRDAMRIDNKMHPRAVTGWQMTGQRYVNGRRISGYLHLLLEGGGWLYYPESTQLDAALDDAASLGFDTTDVRQRLTDWVATGQGATFSLERP